jgi:[ribosomal protein S18]-alanine N-acetyltransferase
MMFLCTDRSEVSTDCGTSTLIRRMNLEHLREVVDIEIHSSLQPWTSTLFLEEMASSLSNCFVIQPVTHSLPRVCGFICFRTLGDESELLNLAVHPDCRRRGMGKELMSFYVEFSKGQNVCKFYLEVDVRNQAALSLYQLFSYKKAGIRPKYYQHRFDALLMLREV